MINDICLFLLGAVDAPERLNPIMESFDYLKM